LHLNENIKTLEEAEEKLKQASAK